MARVILCVLVLALQACQCREKPKEWAYVAMATTGLSRGVRVGDKTVFVKTTAESNAAALASLQALDYDVLMPSAAKMRLIVVGHLSPEVKMTPDAPNLPTAEPYQELRLEGWYLKRPFLQNVWGDDGGLPVVVEERLRTTLAREDFEDFPGIESLSYEALVKAD